MSIQYVSADSNYLRRTQGLITPSDSDSLYPIAGLYDMRQDRPFRFGSMSADRNFKIDLNLAANGGFEAWSGSVPTGHYTGGTVSQVTGGNVRTGTYALQCNVSSGFWQIIKVRPTEVLKARFYGKSSGGGATCNLHIRNLSTNKYLNTLGGWQAGATYCASSSSTSYTEVAKTMTIEDYDTCQQDWVWLYVGGESTVGTCYYDDFALYGQTSWVSVHAHNINPRVVMDVGYSDTDPTLAAPTTWQNGTVCRRGAFAALVDATKGGSAFTAQYLRVQFTGTQLDSIHTVAAIKPIWIGEMVVGQAIQPTTEYKGGFEVAHEFEQVRSETRTGGTFVQGISTDPSRVLKLQQQHTSDAAFRQVRDMLVMQTRGGEYPVAITVDHQNVSISDVLLARIDNSWRVRRLFKAVREGELTFSEEGYPNVGFQQA